MVYDTFLDRYMPWDEYAAEHGAVAERRYTRVEAARLASNTGDHGGPWHKTAGYVRESLSLDYLRQHAPPDSWVFRFPPLRPKVTRGRRRQSGGTRGTRRLMKKMRRQTAE